MRIVGGTWRGRLLQAPPGFATRPTADRVRQALFDMLLHAPWAGPAAVLGARVLDAFAGTGALGLEALSRGAGYVTFIENDRAALAALRANIARCGAAALSTVVVADAAAPPVGVPCTLILLDPPYAQGLAARAVMALHAAGWIASGALIAVETDAREAMVLAGELLAERVHGRARLSIWRA